MSKKSKPVAVKPPTLKQRFLAAVFRGDLGCLEPRGHVVTLKEFQVYFSDITSQYRSSFLPAATLKGWQTTMTHTKFLYRLELGVYLLHSDALKK